MNDPSAHMILNENWSCPRKAFFFLGYDSLGGKMAMRAALKYQVTVDADSYKALSSAEPVPRAELSFLTRQPGNLP